MNLLGHAFLSFNDAEILCGNMMGDFVKGKKILDTYPPKIKEGLMLHRKIDSFTDNHPVVADAKDYFRTDYKLYSGAIIDVLFDHFLANDQRYFHDEYQLFKFTNNIFIQLKETDKHQTPAFKNLRTHLQNENVLNKFRTIDGLRTAMHKLCNRMYNTIDESKAYQSTINNYDALNQYYNIFIDDVILYAKNELNSQI